MAATLINTHLLAIRGVVYTTLLMAIGALFLWSPTVPTRQRLGTIYIPVNASWVDPQRPITPAPDPPPELLHRPIVAAAWQTIAASRRFAPGLVGVGAMVPPELIAWGTILQQDDAASIFADLFASPNSVARLYALCGLYHCDSDAFATGVLAMELSDEAVYTQLGCCIFQDAVSRIIRSPDAITMRDPSQTFAQWRAENPGTSPFTDIAGGATPATMRDLLAFYPRL